METNPIGDREVAKGALEREEARLVRELDAVSAKRQALFDELKVVRESLVPLRGGSKSRTRADAGDLRPSLTDAEAARMVEEVLAGRTAPLDAAALKTRVLDLCRERKVLGTGVHLVLQRVLADVRFVQSKDGYALRSLKSTG